MTGSLINHTIGPYKIVAQIGAGGMATVYKAYHAAMERFVAIKVLPPQMAQEPNFAARFAQEARTISRLEHPFILPVYDSGNKKGLAYIVMRYLETGTLADLLAKGRPHLRSSLRLVQRIAEALDYAHAQGVVHRDLKPSNILIDKNGQPYLTDFGIAKIMESSLNLTGAAILGTPAYMSPEQAQGLSVDHRSDLYALGVILYEAATGRKPFEGSTPMATLQQHIHASPTRPARYASDLHPQLESVILTALEKDPQKRFESAGALAGALEDTLIAMAVASPTATGTFPLPNQPATPPPFTPAPVASEPEAPPAPAWDSPNRESAPLPEPDLRPDTIYRPISEIRREAAPARETVTRLETAPEPAPPASLESAEAGTPGRTMRVLAIAGIVALCLASLAGGAGIAIFVNSSRATAAAFTASVEAAAQAGTGTAQAVALLNAARSPTATATPSPVPTERPSDTAVPTETATATHTRVFLTRTFTPVPLLRVVVKNSWDKDVTLRLSCAGYDQYGTASDGATPALFINVPAGSCNLEGQWANLDGQTASRGYGRVAVACPTGNTFELEIVQDGNLRSARGVCYTQ